MKTTIKIKVLLTERFQEPTEWLLEIPAIPERSDAAEFVFKLSNSPPDFLRESEREILGKFPRTGLRSVSVGDVILIEDDGNPIFHVCTVISSGFKFHDLYA